MGSFTVRHGVLFNLNASAAAPHSTARLLS
jgi:hypothetical protein